MSERPKDLGRQLALLLAQAGVDLVLDVGANIGQYGDRLRRDGYAGRIHSYEPDPDAHRRLADRVATDPAWTLAPPMALGAADGTATLHRSAEPDMSSLKPQTALLERVSPSSAITGDIDVTVRRLDGHPEDLGDAARAFLKIDVQGSETEVLDGAAGLLSRLVGIQLELALLPCYAGDLDVRGGLERLQRLGFDLALVIPGYFDGKLCRQLQIDAVFLRRTA